jgi:hypothetical protein
MAADDTPHADQDEPVVVEIPVERVPAVITMDDIAARLRDKPGRAGDLADELAREIGSGTAR